MTKQQLDSDQRKLKAFFVIKPVIIRDLKKKLLCEKLKLREKKQLCKKSIKLATLIQIIRHLHANFTKKREIHDRELRVVWASMIIKIRMMRKYKLRGPVKERYRTNLRHTVMFQSMCLRPIYEEAAKTKVYRFLFDLSKKKQCIIKIRNTFNRVLTVQRKFRKSIYKSFYDQAKLC